MGIYCFGTNVDTAKCYGTTIDKLYAFGERVPMTVTQKAFTEVVRARVGSYDAYESNKIWCFWPTTTSSYDAMIISVPTDVIRMTIVLARSESTGTGDVTAKFGLCDKDAAIANIDSWSGTTMQLPLSSAAYMAEFTPNGQDVFFEFKNSVNNSRRYTECSNLFFYA